MAMATLNRIGKCVRWRLINSWPSHAPDGGERCATFSLVERNFSPAMQAKTKHLDTKIQTLANI